MVNVPEFQQFQITIYTSFLSESRESENNEIFNNPYNIMRLVKIFPECREDIYTKITETEMTDRFTQIFDPLISLNHHDNAANIIKYFPNHKKTFFRRPGLYKLFNSATLKSINS